VTEAKVTPPDTILPTATRPRGVQYRPTSAGTAAPARRTIEYRYGRTTGSDLGTVSIQIPQPHTHAQSKCVTASTAYMCSCTVDPYSYMCSHMYYLILTQLYGTGTTVRDGCRSSYR
jgi:hypothetical protein